MDETPLIDLIKKWDPENKTTALQQLETMSLLLFNSKMVFEKMASGTLSTYGCKKLALRMLGRKDEQIIRN